MKLVKLLLSVFCAFFIAAVMSPRSVHADALTVADTNIDPGTCNGRLSPEQALWSKESSRIHPKIESLLIAKFGVGKVITDPSELFKVNNISEFLTQAGFKLMNEDKNEQSWVNSRNAHPHGWGQYIVISKSGLKTDPNNSKIVLASFAQRSMEIIQVDKRGRVIENTVQEF